MYNSISDSIASHFGKRIWTKFRRGVRDYELINPGDRIAVCISGGKDSMLMAQCIDRLHRNQEIPFDVEYIIMDPGYSPENMQKILDNAALLDIPAKVYHTRIFESAENLAKFIMGFLNSRGKESEGLAILDEKQMESYVRKQGEIGNEFACFGTLTRDPSPEDFFPGDEKHPPSFKFQMAINRLRHIYTDDPDKRTDFIYFVAYGKYAEFYYNSLKMGSTVYVTGPIITRKFNRKVTCPICGHVMSEPALSLYVKVQNLVFVKNCDYTTSDVGELDYDDISDMEEEEERKLAKAVVDGTGGQEKEGK